MSRAFVNEDAGAAPERYPLPPRDDPGYPLAAARALLRGADVGDTPGAEALEDGNEGLEPRAERFIRRVGRGRA